MAKILEVKNLVVDYGVIRAIKGINLEVEEGAIVAILGANGAGKTSTIRTVNGIVKAASGEILFQGEKITNIEPYKLAAKGIIQSPEGRLILNGLTVEENLMVGAYSVKSIVVETKDEEGNITKKRRSASQLTKEKLKEVYVLFPVLKERKKQQASTLSGGEQQMLAIG
jgi:branched-chain amino acid transport system ATP-binding protein